MFGVRLYEFVNLLDMGDDSVDDIFHELFLILNRGFYLPRIQARLVQYYRD